MLYHYLLECLFGIGVIFSGSVMIRKERELRRWRKVGALALEIKELAENGSYPVGHPTFTKKMALMMHLAATEYQQK